MDTPQRRLPDFVRAAVEQRMGAANIEFAFASDLLPEGRFGESWLVLANDTLLTLRVEHTPIETSTGARLPWLRKNGSQNGSAYTNGASYTNGSAPRVSIHLAVALEEIDSVRTTQLVGAGGGAERWARAGADTLQQWTRASVRAGTPAPRGDAQA